MIQEICSPLKGFLLIVSVKASKEFDFVYAVSNLSPRYVAHCADDLRGVLTTAEIVSVVCKEIFSAVLCTPRK